jgi:hypothetical protein
LPSSNIDISLLLAYQDDSRNAYVLFFLSTRNKDTTEALITQKEDPERGPGYYFHAKDVWTQPLSFVVSLF